MKRLLPCLLYLCHAAASSAATPATPTTPLLSAGRYHNLGLTADGAVYWWGTDFTKQELRKPNSPSAPQRVADLPPAVAIAAGWTHSSAITRDGKVYEWGMSPYKMRQVLMLQPLLGLCIVPAILSGGHGKDPCAEAETARKARMLVDKPIRIPGLPTAAAIAASDSATVMISRDGDVYCWGIRSFPHKIAGLERIRWVALGQFHAVALRDDGAVLSWGSAAGGGTGADRISDSSTCGNEQPRQIFSGAVAVAAGPADSFALRGDGSVWAWGSSWNGDAGFPREDNPSGKADPLLARRIGQLEGPLQFGGGHGPVALNAAGQVVTWYNDYTSLARNAPGLLHKGKAPIAAAHGDGARALASYSSIMTLTQGGFVCTLGENMYGTTRPDSKRQNVPVAVPVMLADGQTPLNLVNTATPVPAVLCGDVRWRERLALLDEIDKQQRQRRQAGNDLILKHGLAQPSRSPFDLNAAEQLRVEVERSLALGKSDLNDPDVDGNTPLLKTLAPGIDPRWAGMLLDWGADPRQHNRYSQNALMFAARNQSVALVRRLLETGLAIDGRSADGSTALMYAADGGNAETVAELLARGADPAVRNLAGDTALSRAIAVGADEIVALLRR